jgi:hypothetical protein
MSFARDVTADGVRQSNNFLLQGKLPVTAAATCSAPDAKFAPSALCANMLITLSVAAATQAAALSSSILLHCCCNVRVLDLFRLVTEWTSC